MKKWWIWVICAALLLAIGIPVGKSYREKQEKAKRQKELWEKMESVTQVVPKEEDKEMADPSSLEGYIDAESLAALEEACDYNHYQVNDRGQTFGTFRMIDVLQDREIEATTEKFRQEHPDFYEELLAAIEKKIREDVWDEEKDWKLEELGFTEYKAKGMLGVSYYFDWDESSPEPDRHLRVHLSHEAYYALLPDLINVEGLSYSADPSRKSDFSDVSGSWLPVAGYITKEDYWAFWLASQEDEKTMRWTTYANDGLTPLQTVKKRERAQQNWD
ncbi:MAG: hypothetical protein IJ744_11615 [Lachnospiraceae bacterium]|nr:hypothetical protein [Lachnospiraceae bacterium]